MNDLHGSWSMSSSSSSPYEGLDEGTMVALTVHTAGAVQLAPRRLHCWFSGGDRCIRDADGKLLWLATEEQTSWLNVDGHIISVTSHTDDDRATLLREPAPEAVAMHNLQSACGWLDVRQYDEIPMARPVALDRQVRRFSGHASRFADVSITCDVETGVVLQIQARSLDHGELAVEASKIEVATRDSIFFDLVEKL
jgi:hypothetical protein